MLNVAPLLALFAGAWIAALRPPMLRGALSLLALVAVVATVAPAWRPQALAATLAHGFERLEVGQDCERLARALPMTDGTVVNRTADSRRQACSMWATFVAREHGGQLAVAAT